MGKLCLTIERDGLAKSNGSWLIYEKLGRDNCQQMSQIRLKMTALTRKAEIVVDGDNREDDLEGEGDNNNHDIADDHDTVGKTTVKIF